MPRVLVTTDEELVMLDERIQASDFAGEHFRHCLTERLRWATEDAEREGAAAATAGDCHGGRSRLGAGRTRRARRGKRRAETAARV